MDTLSTGALVLAIAGATYQDGRWFVAAGVCVGLRLAAEWWAG